MTEGQFCNYCCSYGLIGHGKYFANGNNYQTVTLFLIDLTTYFLAYMSNLKDSCSKFSVYTYVGRYNNTYMQANSQ